MGQKRGYTNAEDRVIIEAIQQSPHNMSHAFEQAAKQLKGRTSGAVSGHYYQQLKPLLAKENIIVTQLSTAHGSIINTKTVARRESQKFIVVKQLATRLTTQEQQKLIDELFNNL